jgi:multidrug efflux pump subunit AcrB
MGIVRSALKLPHTFYVVAALVLFLGSAAVLTMPADIFPEINIPGITVVWQYKCHDVHEPDLGLGASDARQ